MTTCGHNANAYENGFDAWQFGYDDAMFDGVDMSSELPCKCDTCIHQYYKGQDDAMSEIFANRQSAQQTLAPDAVPASDTAQ